MSELPRGWIKASLDELCKFNPRHNADADRSMNVSFIPMPVVSDQEGAILSHETRPLKEVWKGYTHFRDGDVIFAKITPCMENGKIAIARNLHNRMACGSTEFHVLRTRSAVLPDYLWRFLRQKSFREEAERHMIGAVGQRRVPTDYLKGTAIPLAPLNEQKRIVAKLDSLFVRTRKAREELARIPILIEHYKQAVLAAAFRGDLTANWRAETHPRSLEGQPGLIDGRLTELLTLPESWAWTNVGSVGDVSGGLTKNQKRNELPKKIPYLRVANVYANELRLDDIQEIGITDREWARTRLEKSDLLIVEGNGSIEQIGRVAIWDGEIDQCAHQNHLIKVRSHDDIEPKYLLYWLLSPLGRQMIERVASSSSGLHTLSLSKISGLPFPICTKEEMQRIISKIEGALVVLASVADETTKGTYLISNLERAALEKAFHGELVSQDPNDEPADVLLERIRAECGATMNPRRGRRWAAAE